MYQPITIKLEWIIPIGRDTEGRWGLLRAGVPKKDDIIIAHWRIGRITIA
jgi:hypothetical protein